MNKLYPLLSPLTTHTLYFTNADVLQACKLCPRMNFIVKHNVLSTVFGTLSFAKTFETKPNIELNRECRFNQGYDCIRENFMAFCKKGSLKEAMGTWPLLDNVDSFVYSSFLQACLSTQAIEEGIQIHTQIIKTGFEASIYVQNHLVNMYAKLKRLEFSRQVFDKMPERNIVSWTAMIAGYAQQEQGNEAVSLFREMQWVGLGCNQFTYGSVLKACASLESLDLAEHVHAHIVKSGYEVDVFVGSALVDMYAKCGTVEYARQVFEQMPKRDIISWNSMLTGYAQNGYGQYALELFNLMQNAGIKSDKVTLTCVLKGCCILEALRQGRQVHAHVIKSDLESDVSVGNALIDMYGKCGDVIDARKVFNNIERRDVISWNTMISGYAQTEHGEEALNLFCNMLFLCINPSYLTFSIIIRVCACAEALKAGQQVHAFVINYKLESDVSVTSALVDMYAKCGNIEDACRIFESTCEQDIVLWNEMIAGYVQHGYFEETLKLFCQLLALGIEPNQFTFASVLCACARLTDLEQGKQVHVHIIKCKYELDIYVRSALIDIYAKCGSVEEAVALFRRMRERDVVSWSGIIAAYALQGYGEQALTAFCQMQREGMKPDQFTFGSVLKACSTLATLEQSKSIHTHAIKTGFEMDEFVGAALVDMYAKCGVIEDAWKVFRSMQTWDVVLCNAMITGFTQHGYSKEALQLFKQMQKAGSMPNDITLVGVLSACSHAGLVEEGKCHFESMNQVYGVMPTEEHYSCIVDLLGRAGCIAEAENFINNMPFEPGPVIWRTLLSACRIHGNIELGKHAAECLLKLEPQNDAAFVLLSNIYAAGGSWHDVARTRKIMRGKGVKKEPGQSWIEANNMVHSFFTGDRSHPKMKNVYTKLQILTAQMKRTGYVPNRNLLLYDMEKET